MKHDIAVANPEERCCRQKQRPLQNGPRYELSAHKLCDADVRVRSFHRTKSERSWSRRMLIGGACGALVTVLSLAVANPAAAAGPNSTTSLPPPQIPSPATPSQNKLINVQPDTCTGQYSSALLSTQTDADLDSLRANKLNIQADSIAVQNDSYMQQADTILAEQDNALQSSDLSEQTLDQVKSGATAASGLAAATILGVDLGLSGGDAEAAAGVVVPLDAGAAAPGLISNGVLEIFKSVAEGVEAASDGSESGAEATASGLAAADANSQALNSAAEGTKINVWQQLSQAASLAQNANNLDLTSSQLAVENDTRKGLMSTLSLPNCDQIFAGTVTVSAGGVNVTGDSLFNNNVAFAQNASVTGTVSASEMAASQGISADGGKIWIGDTNGATYSSGITLGGGALSGAGYGGAEAYTGDPTAIAIGDAAQADQAGSLALGMDSAAAGVSATAVGSNAQADQTGSLALGFDAVASGVSGTAVGDGSQALADNTVAIGAGAVVMSGAGPGAFAGGTSVVLGGAGAVSIGDSNSASGNGAVAIGDPNVASGTGAVAVGASNMATGQGAVAVGNLDSASGQGAVAIGDQDNATGVAAIAEGQGSNATADGSIALGRGATADATNATAIGQGSNAEAADSTAIGPGATVGVGDVNSTAIGAGATTSYSHQIVLGTGGETVTAPGLDNPLSRSRQLGPLGLVTTDAMGDLASDNGALFKHLAFTEAGVAIAFALPNPTVTSSRRHAIMFNLATYYGAYGLGVGVAGSLGNSWLTPGDTVTLSGAIGWGRASEEGYTESNFGARVGLEYSW